jgi:hypothetical protein
VLRQFCQSLVYCILIYRTTLELPASFMHLICFYDEDPPCTCTSRLSSTGPRRCKMHGKWPGVKRPATRLRPWPALGPTSQRPRNRACSACWEGDGIGWFPDWRKYEGTKREAEIRSLTDSLPHSSGIKYPPGLCCCSPEDLWPLCSTLRTNPSISSMSSGFGFGLTPAE